MSPAPSSTARRSARCAGGGNWTEPYRSPQSRVETSSFHGASSFRRLLRVRRDLGLTQARLAERIGAAGKAVVYQWESRERKPSSALWKRVERLMDAFSTEHRTLGTVVNAKRTHAGVGVPTRQRRLCSGSGCTSARAESLLCSLCSTPRPVSQVSVSCSNGYGYGAYHRLFTFTGSLGHHHERRVESCEVQRQASVCRIGRVRHAAASATLHNKPSAVDEHLEF